MTDHATFRETAALRAPTMGQVAVWGGLVVGLTAGLIAAPGLTGVLAILAIQIAFVTCAAWRVVLVIVSRRPGVTVSRISDLPRYTVLVALLDEAELVPQLVERLAQIDYPPDRLQGLLLLEAHDRETLEAVRSAVLPEWLSVLVVPAGNPQTKPRALNHGLAHASGDLLTVYDAEDDPDPLQLREAAERFFADTSLQVAALQAPLRIRRSSETASPFLDRQFAVEYAALFEVSLPGIARLGLPFPLGGTSNHFRTESLRIVGGWDAHNVTEDADLGFRLWRSGYRLGVLNRPTYEPPPGDLAHWLPQRTRWLKGFMQTWGVHTRRVRGLGWRGGMALTLTLGAALASASVHAFSIAWVAATIAISVAAGLPPDAPRFSLSVLIMGAASAWLNGLIGARRAGVDYRASDMLASPAYWSLLSLAFAHAVWRLVRDPFSWDKTPHRPEMAAGPSEPACERPDAGRRAA